MTSQIRLPCNPINSNSFQRINVVADNNAIFCAVQRHLVNGFRCYVGKIQHAVGVEVVEAYGVVKIVGYLLKTGTVSGDFTDVVRVCEE